MKEFEILDYGVDYTLTDGDFVQFSTNAGCFNHHSCNDSTNSAGCTNTSACIPL